MDMTLGGCNKKRSRDSDRDDIPKNTKPAGPTQEIGNKMDVHVKAIGDKSLAKINPIKVGFESDRCLTGLWILNVLLLNRLGFFWLSAPSLALTWPSSGNQRVPCVGLLLEFMKMLILMSFCPN